MPSPAWLSKTNERTGKILCEACAQACVLGEGETGICGIRSVKNGALELAVYGLAAALNIDPVEKKPLYHFLPGSSTLSFGTVGCNLSCSFCQNADISQYPKEHPGAIKGHDAAPEQLVALALERGCESISYTYNEPAVFFEYAYDTAKLAHAKGLKNIFVTSGYETPKAIDTIAPYLDAMNIDLKAFSDDFYRSICGARLKPVLEAIRHAHAKGIWVEITTLLIPGLNDSNDELRQIAEFIASVSVNIPWHISGFYPQYKMQNRPRTPHATLQKAYAIGIAAGLRYCYVGNVADPEHTATYCPACHTPAIRRHGHLGEVVDTTLTSGRCPACGEALPGVWSNP